MSFPYSQETETRMQELYNRLPEKIDVCMLELKPQSLGEEASVILLVFLIVRVILFYAELQSLAKKMFWKSAIGKQGGGRSPILLKPPDINNVFLQLLKEHTAGDPMNEKIKWTNLSCSDIASLLTKEGFKVSRNIVRKLLKNHGYVKRKALKKSLQASI